ncbi:hypothetical protein [Williamsia sterculiae]|uniref:Polyketide cyclase / dehydrase and lipid transport n=1 Tax=Williamsia sterculiae TaxID=1344003 RepID=A0A1N7H8W5_9NOCA|nr:hypothetical protein [Williamsia sterculiae]SIS21307.1 hypothetical protein SAMN05445060_3723 [Williamsia sterculiae]
MTPSLRSLVPTPLRELGCGATGPATVAQVWWNYVHPQAWSTWAPQIRRVDYPHRTLTPGVGGSVYGPLSVRVFFEVERVDAVRHTWQWRVWLVTRRLGIRLRHGVDSVDGHPGSRAWVTVEAPAPVVAPYVPLASYALHRLVHLTRS